MKVQNPIIGRARGSAGGMTFCKNYDKNVARAKAFEVANPKTAAQTTQRNYFKDLSALVATFTEEQLRFLFPNKPKTMSRRNALAKQLAEYFIVNAGVKSVDYGTIDTIGNASTCDFGNVTFTPGENNYRIEIDEPNIISEDLKFNYFVAALVNVTKKQISLDLTSGTVNNGFIEIPIPQGWADDDAIHPIPLITNQTAQPTGFGSMYVVKRPAKANA